MSITTLPAEVLLNVLTFLPDTRDIVAARSTCHALKQACALLKLPVQWPKAHTSLDALPWTPSTIIVTQHTPLSTRSTPIIAAHVSCLYYDNVTYPTSLFAHVTHIKLDRVCTDVDFRSLTQLCTLDMASASGVQHATKLPATIKNITVNSYNLINFAGCMHLQKVVLSFCRIKHWPALAQAQEVTLKYITNVKTEHLQQVPKLAIVHCDNVQQPDTLMAHTVQLHHTGWSTYPRLPNVVHINVIETRHVQLSAQDVSRCVVFKMSMPKFTQLIVPQHIQELCLQNCKADAQLPMLANLNTLKLVNCVKIRLPTIATSLHTLHIDKAPDVNVCNYLKLQKLTVDNATGYITLNNLPGLLQLTINTAFPMPLAITNVPAIRSLHIYNTSVHEDDIISAQPLQYTGVPVLRIPLLHLYSIRLFGFHVTSLMELQTVIKAEFNMCFFTKTPMTDWQYVQNIDEIKMQFCFDIPSMQPFARATRVGTSNCVIQEPVSNFDNLKLFSIRDDLIDCDILPLTINDKLNNLHTLLLETWTLTDVSFLSNHPHLVTLYINHSRVQNLEPLATIPTLRNFAAMYCDRIIDATPVRHVYDATFMGCKNLTIVRVLTELTCLNLHACKSVDPDDVTFLRKTVPFVLYDSTQVDQQLSYFD